MLGRKNLESGIDIAGAEDWFAPNEHRALQIGPFLVQCGGLDHGADGVETVDSGHEMSDALKMADGKFSLDTALAGPLAVDRALPAPGFWVMTDKF